MTLEGIANLINIGIGPVIKFLLLLIIFLYGVFAAVIARQVQLMNKVVNEVNFAPLLFSTALIHVMVVIVLFLLTLIIL